ncbi:MAG: histidinol-phosphatase [Bacillota bacterium]|jgi:histidinol-phosphatase (PHP family)
MKILANYHTHTNFCDGQNSAEEMVLAAIKAGFSSLGFSGHSYTPFDEEASMSPDNTRAYIKEIKRLKEKYSNQIQLHLGIEKDYYSQINRQDFEYLIGSVHYIKDEKTKKFYSIDNTPEELESCIENVFCGNVLKMVQRYYELIVDMAQKQKPDIIGHFDLIKKLNAGNRYFDEDAASYRKIALRALEKAAQCGCIFEINSGGLYKKYTDCPYPADFLLTRLAQLGASVIISSDAHDIYALDFYFAEMLSSLPAWGFKEVTLIGQNGFFKTRLK